MRGLFLLLVGASVTGCLVPQAPPPLTGPSGSEKAVTPKKDALELSLKKWPDGAAWHLSGERGKVVLLDVWATWCEPCKDSLPLYEDLLKQYGAKGLTVFAINVDADPREVERFVAQNHVTLPILVDPEARVSEVELKVKMMPTSLLVDRQGVVRHVNEGFAEELVSKYVTTIEQLLAEPAP
jgi:thiol-disulfide isomerase/thioredoxin